MLLLYYCCLVVVVLLLLLCVVMAVREQQYHNMVYMTLAFSSFNTHIYSIFMLAKRTMYSTCAILICHDVTEKSNGHFWHIFARTAHSTAAKRFRVLIGCFYPQSWLAASVCLFAPLLAGLLVVVKSFDHGGWCLSFSRLSD